MADSKSPDCIVQKIYSWKYEGGGNMSRVNLTEREMLVMQYLADGLSNEEISDILHISVHTTKAHLESIYEKLNVHNRVQAVIKAVKLELININEVA